MRFQLSLNGLSFNSFILKFVLVFTVVVVQVHTQGQNSSTLTGVDENETNEWEAPLRVQKLFPCYISGFDEEGRPIVTFQYGRWDLRAFLEEGGSNFEIIDKYFKQLVDQMHDSPKAFAQSRDVNQYIVVADLEGYELRQLSHIPSVRITLDWVRYFFKVDQQESRFSKAYLVNVNFVFQTLYTLGSPIIGHLAGLVELYGTKPEVWKPALFRNLPRSQLPEWLGGFANHTHAQVLG